MDFAVLGPLLVVGDDGPIEIRAAKQRSLLAMLLLARREAAVSVERLVDVLWGEEPPQTAVKALQGYVSNVRRALGPAGARIVTPPGGYALELAAGGLARERLETRGATSAGAGGRRPAGAAADPPPRR